jgi:hypothetical protein
MPDDEIEAGASADRWFRGVQNWLAEYRTAKFRCPTCLRPIDPRSVWIEDYEGGRREGPMPVRGVFRRFPRGRAMRPDEILRTARYLCPRGHTLPRGLFQVGLKPVALLGLSQSMKTHYIAAVSQQLAYDRQFAAVGLQSLTVEAIEECRDRLRRVYLTPLFEEQRVLTPTVPILDPTEEPVREPITFEVTHSRGVPTSLPHTTYFSLFDAPGEMFATTREQLRHAPYLLDPAGVLLFVDVAAMRSVRRTLGSQAPENKSIIDPHIITAAADVMRRTRGILGRVQVPVSVVVSRADLLVGAEEFAEYQDALGGEPLLDPGASDRARSFLKEHAPGVVVATGQAFGDQVRYFFSSATGCAPNADETFDRVEPWGCVGPLFWLFNQNGFFSDES